MRSTLGPVQAEEDLENNRKMNPNTWTPRTEAIMACGFVEGLNSMNYGLLCLNQFGPASHLPIWAATQSFGGH